ncbi:iron-siderophore ABC transporter substrate-binding protein [Cyanobacterium aponinum]|uniref:ABC transporter substrate-binding protein n=1 Tax=Cyanobacterium aponinum 0216 TaxID=2676140 RepID=A0A844GVI8_9CHRO|nr:iron-siderophore ABC transporter substrate-binding protein [Cyanobacterium aponinum]MTF40494.1 ABC transporter substrate-binding protein [Cyanobacterium aponinum 0216]
MKKLYLIILLTLTIACQKQTLVSSIDCHTIIHGVGKTCVPNNPQRIIALNGSAIDSLLVLDIQPVGVITNVPDLLAEKVTHIPKVGLDGTVNLEMVAKLQPDLILGSVYSDSRIYNQLSQIAPTVLDEGETNGEWQKNLLFYGKVLGKQEEIKQLLQKYQGRLVEFKQKMGSKLSQTQVSLVRVYPQQISLYLNNSFAGSILEDAGLSRPAFQNQGIKGKSPFQIMISREQMSLADGDVIFLWTYGVSEQTENSAIAQLEKLKKDPLWQQLEAVKTNQAYQIPPYWNVPSLIAAHAVIDDLFRYLVDEKQ